MARKPQVRYFPSRKAYYCQHQGKQHKLAVGPDDAPTGPTYLAALAKFRDLLALGNAGTAKDTNTVRVVLEHYLRFVDSSERKLNTFKIRQKGCLAFCNGGYGEVRVCDLTPFMVAQFLEAKRSSNGRHQPWGAGTARTFLDTLHAAFGWGVKCGLITVNPVAGMEKPSGRSRGRDCILSPEQHRLALGKATRWFRPFVVLLENTGARPGEIAAATAADWRPDLGAFVYHAEANRQEGEFSHKTGRKGKDRVIFVTGEALEMVRDLVKRHPTGPLLRTYRGKPWIPTAVVQAFRVLRARTGISRMIPYSYRHTYATNWLKAGGSIDVLAELLGNTPATIRKHYSHLCGDLAGLRAQAEAFKTGGGQQSPQPRLRVIGE